MLPVDGEVTRIVRAGDPDRYLASLYAPVDLRPALLALYAFNVEIASVRDRISEPMPGEIRLQWWRDVLGSESDTGSSPGHPVATALLSIIREHRLPVQAFLDMLDARIFDLYDDPMPSRTDLEGYCGETASALIQLSALVLDPQAAERTATLAGHAGCAQAIAGLLRLLPIHLRRGQCYIPLELIAAAGTTRDALVSREDRTGARRAAAALAALGREHLSAFVKDADRLSPSLRPAYLPIGLADAYLRRVESGAVDPLEETVSISPLLRHWILLSRAMRGW